MCCRPDSLCACTSTPAQRDRDDSATSVGMQTGCKPSLARPPQDGARVAAAPDQAPKLRSPAQSGADPGEAALRLCKQLCEVIDQQTKRELRTGQCTLDQGTRSRLWLAILKHHGPDPDSAEEYRETVEQLEGEYGPARGPQRPRPPLMLACYSNHYELDREAVWTAERILAVLHYNNPAVTFSPPIFSVCCLLLHYLDETDVYTFLCLMLKNNKLGFLVQTKRQCEISWRTLVKLCRKHARGSMRFLQRYAGSMDNVKLFLADWLAWIFCHLPFGHVVRIFDCYLMEGEKVLYRAAMALVVQLHKHADRQPCREKAGRWSALLDQCPLQEVMKTFCQEIPVPPRKLLKTMFNIRAFSRVTLTASYSKAREQIRAGGGRLTFPESTFAADSEAHFAVPSLVSQRELERCSSTIGIKELLQLWENVPRRFALYSPRLLFTSSEHGFSLNTFYQRVGAYEPTVLLLRTTEGAVFGAYCSCSWNTRNQLLEDGSRRAYFGTGETFLFTLRPEVRVFRWVGRARQSADPSLCAVSRSQQLFLAADAAMLTVGGGGGQAIWLDESLSHGRTDRCDTFDNPPLTETGSFEVACLEAFGFAPA